MPTIELRLKNVSSDTWRDELISALSKLDPSATVKEASLQPAPDSISQRAIDPTVLVALISGGATVIAALIPQLVLIFKKKDKEQAARIVILIHGTKDSAILRNDVPNLGTEVIDRALTRIGSLTGIEVRSEK